ncbi:MAG: pitrilysin family protein [Rhodovibrionaceae bacterium]
MRRIPVKIGGRGLLFTLVLGGVLLLGRGFPPAQAEVFDPTSFTLDNGLQVVVVENHRAPIVNQMIWYRVGSADEPRGKSGIAHFLEHLMFKGTDTLAPGEFSKIIARNGGEENAFTSYDYTGYYQTVAADRLEIVMQHEADRMRNLKLTEEVVLPEREVILEERRSRVDNNPGSQLGEMRNAVLFLHHPYGTPIIGWEHEMRGLTTEDALAFYDSWYAPNNALLVITGDVEPAEVKRLAEKYYGPIARRDVPERARVQEPPHLADVRVELADPLVRQESVSVTYLAPSLRTEEVEGRALALQLLDQALSGGATSRFYRRLVVEQGTAVSAGARYGGDDYDMSSFTFYVSPRDGVELGGAEAALRSEIEALIAEGITAEELEKAKRSLRGIAVYARDSISAPGRIIGTSLMAGATLEDIETWPERIEALTLEEVNAAIEAVFKDAHSVTSILKQEPTS